MESVENSLHAVAGLMFDTTEVWHTLIYIILIVLIAVVCDVVCKLLINKLLLPVIRRTRFEWDDHLYDKKVVSRLAALAPAFILYALLPSAFEPEGSWYVLTERICKVYIIALILRFLNGMLNAFLDIFNEKEEEPAEGAKSGKGGASKDGIPPEVFGALRMGLEGNPITISGMQRRLGLGFPKAAKLFDYMKDMHFIEPTEDGKKHKICITEEELEALMNGNGQEDSEE